MMTPGIRNAFERAHDLWFADPQLQYQFPDLQTFAQHYLTATRGDDLELFRTGAHLIRTDNARAAMAEARIARVRHPLTAKEAHQLVERQGNRLVLWLFGPVGATAQGCSIDATAVITALRDHSDALGIYLRIDSGGGSLADARAIAEALRRHRARKLAIIDHACWSAAGYFLAPVHRVLIRRNASLMFHPTVTTARGNSLDLMLRGQAVDSEDRRYQHYLSAMRGTDIDVLRTLWQEKRFVGADEAVALGLADKVIPPLLSIPDDETGLDSLDSDALPLHHHA